MNGNCIKINCPYCLKEQLVFLFPIFKVVYCDIEVGGCDIPFTVEFTRSFSQEPGKNVLEISATVRKIEGIVPEFEKIAPSQLIIFEGVIWRTMVER